LAGTTTEAIDSDTFAIEFALESEIELEIASAPLAIVVAHGSQSLVRLITEKLLLLIPPSDMLNVLAFDRCL
jgi:hypothetical protein